MTNQQDTPKQNTTYPLRLPQGLRRAVAEYAKREGSSMNQFIAMAVAEKLSALDTAEYFKTRAARADMDEFWALLNRSDGLPPKEGDELPVGYTPVKRGT